MLKTDNKNGLVESNRVGDEAKTGRQKVKTKPNKRFHASDVSCPCLTETLKLGFSYRLCTGFTSRDKVSLRSKIDATGKRRYGKQAVNRRRAVTITGAC
ncbi:hypothetical protein CDAR_496031 [Caerostris darwini]|uniref:Uncharacterized protein n=1 Tax=Caerostris darwini TaxID=1538125 RepID=A0AAV4U1V2_9ARAC|nr:hypothetical protein CDAR_496031 [Caerostris darwini]